jgi:adenine-specific DNA glycosylase
MKTPVKTSPFCLIQEEFRHEPWKLLVCCICLNQTSIKQVRGVISAFFEKYPTAAACSCAHVDDVIEILRPLGFYNKRASTIIKMSSAFEKAEVAINNLPGVGKYATDSWRIFVDGVIDVVPSDKKLQKYVEWAMSQNNGEP